MITKDEHCSILWDNSLNKWSHILISNDTSTTLCNDDNYRQNLIFSNYPYLQSFTIYGNNMMGYMDDIVFEGTLLILLLNKIFHLSLQLPFLDGISSLITPETLFCEVTSIILNKVKDFLSLRPLRSRETRLFSRI